MKNAVGKSKSQACLPYGMVFTMIFREAGIELDGENCKPLKHTDYYSIHTLNRMKFHKEGDEWIREGEEEQPEEVSGSSSSSPSDSTEPSSLAPDAGPSSPALATAPLSPPPTLTPASVADEHHCASLTHTMPHTFSVEGVMD